MNDILDNPNHATVLYIVNTLNKVHDTRISVPWVQLTPHVDCGQTLREALRQFQTYFAISPTGQYDVATEQLLLKLNLDISYAMKPVEEALIDDKKPGQPITQGLDEEELFILKHLDQITTVSADVINVISETSVYASYPIAVVAEKLTSYNQKMKFANSLIKQMIKDMNEGMKPSPIWEGVDTKAAQMHRRSPNLEKVDETLKSVGNKAKERTPYIYNKVSASLRSYKIETVMKKAGLIGYSLQAACVIYHGISLANSDATDERQKSDDFINSLGGFYGTVATGVATGVVAGAAGGPVGMIIGIAVAVLDVALVATTGKSLGDYLFDVVKYFGGDIHEKQITPLANDMIRYNSGGWMNLNGNLSSQLPW